MILNHNHSREIGKVHQRSQISGNKINCLTRNKFVDRSASTTSQPGDVDDEEAISSNNLLQKLNTLAEQRTSSVEEKRKSFQKRPRDDWRTRTQPVTLEELEEAGK